MGERNRRGGGSAVSADRPGSELLAEPSQQRAEAAVGAGVSSDEPAAGKTGSPSGGAANQRDFIVRVRARFLKDPSISAAAKFLWVLLTAFADGRTKRTYVKGKTLDDLLHRSRQSREAVQRELIAAGYLRLEVERGPRARWGRRIYVLLEPAATDAALTGNGADRRRSKQHPILSQTPSYQQPRDEKRSSPTTVAANDSNGDDKLLSFLLDNLDNQVS